LLFGGVFTIVYIAIFVVTIAAWWKVFTKAGKPGWTAIIPLLDTLQVLDLAGKPWWYLILMMIPFVNIVMLFIISLSVARAFGKGAGFGIGLVVLPFIFYLILGFGSAQYQRPADFPPTWLNL
jgi:hypothetical protein